MTSKEIRNKLEFELKRTRERETKLEQALSASMENRTVYLGFSTTENGGGHSMHRYFGVPGTDLLLVSAVSYSGSYTPYYSGLTQSFSDTPQHILDRLEALKKGGWERGE